jgi:hypothetical protein
VEAQELRLDSRLLEARELLRACTAPACPTLVRTDCGTLLAEIQRAVPTVILELLNPELNPKRVQLSVNGQLRPLEFGQAYEFDAGALKLRVDAPGYEPLEETLIVREGEKNRLVPIRLALPGPPPLPVMLPTPASLPRSSPPEQARAEDVPGTAAAPYVLASIALVATATSVYFAWSALDQRARLKRQCAPLCSDDDRRAVANGLLVADIAGGVALAAASVSITLFVLSSQPADAQARLPGLGVDGIATGMSGTLW